MEGIDNADNVNIKNNTISNCIEYPISILINSLKASIFGGISDNKYINNRRNSVELNYNTLHYGQISTDMHLTKGIYDVTGSMWIPKDITFTIEPGTVMLFDGPWSFYIEGTMIIKGNAVYPVVVTAYKDSNFNHIGECDVIGGDHWGGFRVKEGGLFNGEYVKIRYADTGIENYNGRVRLINSAILDSARSIKTFNEKVTLLFNTFSNNEYGMSYINGLDAPLLDARFNYWDSPTGPSIYTYINKESVWIGDGDKISIGNEDEIVYYPFLKHSYTTVDALHFGKNGVNAATGNYSRTYTDMSIKVPGFDIGISRTYNSLDDREDSPFGRGWTFSLEGSVKEFGNIALVKLPNGSMQVYDKNSDGYTGKNTRNKLQKDSSTGVFTLTTKELFQYEFNSSGNLTLMRDGNGNTVKIHDIDPSTKTREISNGKGRNFFTICYNDQNLIDYIIDAAGIRVDYHYNSDKQLFEVTGPLRNKITYGYDGSGFLDSVTDSYGKLIESLVYNHSPGPNLNLVVSLTDAMGKMSTYYYDFINSQTVIVSSDRGDGSNKRQTVQGYDSMKHISRYEDPYQGVTTIEYNEFGEELSQTDRYGNVTIYERDDRGNIITIVNPDKSRKEIGYYSNNNLMWEKDEEGNYTFYEYDNEQKNLVRKAKYRYKVALTDRSAYPVLGADNEDDFDITVYTYFPQTEAQKMGYSGGLLQSVKDPEGGVITYDYDTNGNIKSIEDPESTAENPIITIYSYDVIGRKMYTVSPKGYRVDYIYDDNGMLEKTIQTGGNKETTRITYDNEGRKMKEVFPNLYNENLDDINNHFYNGDHGYRYTYYDNGKLKTVTDPDNNVTKYWKYDIYGNLEIEEKPNGSVYRYTYDVLDRLTGIYFVSSFDRELLIPLSEELLEEYSYGTLDGKTLPDGTVIKYTSKIVTRYLSSTEFAITSYILDDSGRLVLQKNPDGGTISNEYYLNGKIKSHTDLNGNKTYYKYDLYNPVEKYKYDEKWTPFKSIKNGTSIITKYSYSKIIYDRNGRVKSVVTENDEIGVDYYESADSNGDGERPTNFVTATYNYYKNGKLQSITEGTGKKVFYHYDNDGILESEKVYTSPTEYNLIEYNNNHLGKPLQKKVYVKAGEILYSDDSINSTNTVLVTDYSYDKNGNLKTITYPDRNTLDTFPDRLVTVYGYDNMNRQTSVSQTSTNEEGEIITLATSTTYGWNGKPLTKTDANGNTTKYEYNLRGLETKTIRGILVSSWTDPGYAETEGTWSDSGISGYRTNNSRTTTAQNSKAVWTLTLPVEGQYNVYTWYPYDVDNTKNANFTVKSNEISDSKSIDQSLNVGKWNLIGTYTFKKGTDEKISVEVALTSGTGKTQADSLMFEPVLPREVTSFSYDRGGRKIAEVTPQNYDISKAEAKDMNNRFTYAYDSMDRLKAVGFIGYEFKVGALNTLEQSSLNITLKAYDYDYNGNVIKEWDALGLQKGYYTEYTYTPQNQIETVLDPVGRERGLTFTSKYEYDTIGRIFRETLANRNPDEDKESITTYLYTFNKNENGEIISTDVKKKVNITDPNANASESVVEQNIYDLTDNLIVRIDGNKKQTTYLYNAFGKVKQVNYPGDTQQDFISILPNTVEYSYDVFGNLRKQKDTFGTIDLYTYDGQGRVLTHTTKKEDNQEAINTSMGYDKNGNVIYTVDGNLNRTDYSYDEFNRLISTKISVNNADSQVSIHTSINNYDLNGNIIGVTKRVEARGKTVENTFTYIYDPLDRLVQKNYIKFEENIPYAKTIHMLEYYHNSTQSKSYEAPNDDSTNFNVTEFKYDKNNRLIATIDPEHTDTDLFNHIETREYDNLGSLYKKVDGRGNVTTYRYDELNRLVEVENAKKEKTIYIYDLNGNMLSQQIGRENAGGIKITKFYYNAANKLSKRVDPLGDGIDSKTELYTYYPNGNLKTKKDKKGQVTTYIYDIHGRLKNETVGDITITYGYDNNGNQTSITAGTEIVERQYDELNRVKVKTVTYDQGSSLKTSYTYDIIPEASGIPGVDPADIPLGCIAEKTADSRNNEILKVYDGEGKLVYIVSEGSTTTYEYYENGSRKSVTYPGGAKEVYSYHKDNLLKQLINYKMVNGQIVEMDRYTYEYDGAHNQDYKIEYINGKTIGRTDYAYDELNRLIQVKEPDAAGKTTDYVYDASGNRWIETITKGTEVIENKYYYNEQNRLTNVESRVNSVLKKKLKYGYDENGNRTTTTEHLYNNDIVSSINVVEENQYDELNRLINTIADGVRIQNTYNGEGLRVTKKVGNALTRYFYEYDKVILETDSSGNQIARSVYGTNLLIKDINGLRVYYMYNGHGDVSSLINANTGEVIEDFYYDSFGNVTSEKILYGDADSDGIVTANDYALTRDYVLAKISKFPSPYGKRAADVNGSGSIDSTDCILIQRHILGIITYFPPDRNQDEYINDRSLTGYAGYQYDNETGLYYLNARMYDPKIARFLQEDTYLGDPNDPLSLNLYAYCHNEPIMYIDPSGHNNILNDFKEKLKHYAEKKLADAFNAVLSFTVNTVTDYESTEEAIRYVVENPGEVAKNVVYQTVSDIKETATETVDAIVSGDVDKLTDIGAKLVVDVAADFILEKYLFSDLKLPGSTDEVLGFSVGRTGRYTSTDLPELDSRFMSNKSSLDITTVTDPDSIPHHSALLSERGIPSSAQELGLDGSWDMQMSLNRTLDSVFNESPGTGVGGNGFGKNPNIVRRAVTPEQAEAILNGKGIIKETPFHKTTPTQHVAGTKHSRNPWTSTTKRAESAEYFATHGGTRPANPIVEIDLSKINPENILDVSTTELAAQHLKTPFTRNAASFHQEVLIKGDIPQEAIIGFVNK
ncbi:MAG: RHS repeat-associated core domain-containing protein [Bacillota bacterium]